MSFDSWNSQFGCPNLVAAIQKITNLPANFTQTGKISPGNHTST